MVHQVGVNGVAMVAPIVVGEILANSGISFDADKILDSLPGRDAFGHMVIKNAADTIILMKSSIKLNPYVFISCDKGNKKGNKNLAICLCWYCKFYKRVRTYLLGFYCTDKNIDDIANTIKHSLKLLFHGYLPLKIFDQCTNSGGGGTGKKFYVTLKNLGVTAPIYHVTGCSFHNLQTTLHNGVQLVLGEGGLDNEGKCRLNYMQLLHDVYNFQNWHEHEELKDIYLFTWKEEGLNEKCKNLEEPILTRWRLVGCCSCSFLGSSTTWERICKGIHNTTPSDSAVYKVASAT